MTRQFFSCALRLGCVAFALLGLAPATSRAGVTFSESNIPGTLNVNFGKSGSGFQITGTTNNVSGNIQLTLSNGVGQDTSGNSVNPIGFMGGSGLVVEPWLPSPGDATNYSFTQATATIQPMYAMSAIDFKLDTLVNGTNDHVVMVATDTDGHTYTSQNLAFTTNGENDFSAVTNGGTLLSSITFEIFATGATGQFGAEDIHQVSIEFQAIPEPTALALWALGALGSALGTAVVGRFRKGIGRG